MFRKNLAYFFEMKKSLKIRETCQKIRNLDTFWIYIRNWSICLGNASIPYINSKSVKISDFFTCFPEFFTDFFISKNIPIFFWTSMSIQNFPRIPKITLRTPCDQAKDTKNASTVKNKKTSSYGKIDYFAVHGWLQTVSCSSLHGNHWLYPQSWL